MGGVAGHLSHLYDNRSLTYNKMAEILRSASTGELIGTEKTDGYNIYLGFVDGKARYARNKGDMATGGMTMNELSARVFKGGDSAKEVFINSFKSYEKAVNSLSIKERAQIFGPAGEVFYNSEIQGQRKILKDGKEVFVPLNVVNYDENILSIHRVGHKRYNKDTNKLEIVNTIEQSAFLDELIDRFDEITLNESFKIKRTALLELNKITDDTFVENILNTIKNTGYSGDMTINDYLESQFKPIIDQKFANLDENMRLALVDRILKRDNAQSLAQISKGLLKEKKEEISAYVLESSPLAIQNMMEPIELAIHDFSVRLLKELKSAYVLDNSAEVNRLKLETRRAIETIRDYRDLDYDKAHNILAKQITKLKHHDSIDTVVEGFVFEYDDQMYKFTGNFAPMNQLLGLFRFGRGNIPPMLKEAVLEQNEADNSKEIIAVYPGRFQPMGKHHAKVFTGDGEVPGIQDIYGKDNSFIATSDAKIKPNSPFTFAQKKKIIEAHGIDPNVIFKVKNPYYAKEITNNYDPETYRVVYLVGAKDMAENPRFAKTEGTTKEGFDWSIEVAPHVSIEIPEYGEMCGTTCRLALKDATEEEFETIMGFKNPEVYQMIKDVLSKQILPENTQFLDIFRELTDEVLLEEGWLEKRKERKAIADIYDKFPLTLRKPRRANNVREWTELGATPKMINQLLTLIYYGEVYDYGGINSISYVSTGRSVVSRGIRDVKGEAWSTKKQLLKRAWPSTNKDLKPVPFPAYGGEREEYSNFRKSLINRKIFFDQINNYYKSIGPKWSQIAKAVGKTIPMPEEPGPKKWVEPSHFELIHSPQIRRAGGYYVGGGPSAKKQHEGLIKKKMWLTMLQLYESLRKQVKTWQEFVALNNYPPAIEVRGDELVESDASKNARKEHLENVVYKALPLSMPLEVVISGKFDSWIKGAAARYGGGLSLATPKGEKGALSVADRPGELSLAEKYVKRPCKKKSKTKGDKTGDCAVVSHKTGKQKACYDDCEEARAVTHLEEEEELEEITGVGAVAGYAGPVGRPRRRKIKEQEVNEALNYLLQKLGV